MLRDEDYLVNVHLVYTLQQAYMAMAAGATYVCPLVGRSQDQGLDAISLIQQCVETVNYYGYDTKIMFSSVRNIEHIRNGLSVGVHTHHCSLENNQAIDHQQPDRAGHQTIL